MNELRQSVQTHSQYPVSRDPRGEDVEWERDTSIWGLLPHKPAPFFFPPDNSTHNILCFLQFDLGLANTTSCVQCPTVRKAGHYMRFCALFLGHFFPRFFHFRPSLTLSLKQDS